MASSLTEGAAAQDTPASGGKTFFGHPRGLATLFMTEMWERFSFYGMRALLVLYLVAPAAKGGLGFAAATGAAIYSVYNACVYLLAMPGGWIADRLWGPRKTVAIAGVIIMCGHFLLAVPFEASFFVGLVFIAVGSGFSGCGCASSLRMFWIAMSSSPSTSRPAWRPATPSLTMFARNGATAGNSLAAGRAWTRSWPTAVMSCVRSC